MDVEFQGRAAHAGLEPQDGRNALLAAATAALHLHAIPRHGDGESQVYMARKRNVGADNAEKISRGVASILGLSEEERLRLKAETMGHPGELVRAYLGDSRKTARLLDVPESTATEILDEERHNPQERHQGAREAEENGSARLRYRVRRPAPHAPARTQAWLHSPRPARPGARPEVRAN
jgi:hypothetical protein